MSLFDQFVALMFVVLLVLIAVFLSRGLRRP